MENNNILTKIEPINGVDLKVTNTCNLRCEFCVNADYPGKKGDVNTKMVIRALNQLLNSDSSLANLQNVFFTGGEPLLRLDNIIEIAKSLPRTVLLGVNTNGLILDNKKIKRLKNANIKRIKFSYDTTDKKDYLIIRKGSKEDDFDKLERNIKLAAENNFIIFWRVALGKMNYRLLNSIYQRACSMGVDTLQIKPIVASGRAIFNKGQLSLSHNEIVETLKSLRIIIDNNKTKVSISCFPPASNLGLTTKFCANKNKFYLDVNGNIYHCNYIQDDNNLLGNYYDVDGIKKALIKRKKKFNRLFNNIGVISNCPALLNYLDYFGSANNLSKA